MTCWSWFWKEFENIMTVDKSATRKKRTAPTKRRALRPQIVVPKGRILNEEEKRELILAYAELRKKRSRDPLQLTSLYAGVAVTSIIVIAGWVYAFSPKIMQAVQDPLGGSLTAQATELKNIAAEAEVSTGQDDIGVMLKQATEGLNSIYKQAQGEKSMLDRLAESVSSTVVSGDQGGFNHPVTDTTSTTAVKRTVTAPTSTSIIE